MTIREFDNGLDRAGVIALWNEVFGVRTGRHDPAVSIDAKRKQNDRLFFVAVEGAVIGTVMAGYDGHRGWIYAVAVAPSHRNRGIGSALMRHAEAALAALGCLKINLQVMPENQPVVAFYEKLGYVVEPRISMGKAVEVKSGGDKR